MKKLKIYTISFIIFLFISLPLFSMRINRSSKLRNLKKPPQKRTLLTTQQLNFNQPFTQSAEEIHPLRGAITVETGAMKRMYAVEYQAFGPQLVKELFYQQQSQFKPTVNKSKAAYALSPGILGLVIGALETNKLQDPATREYIINQWIDEFKRISGEKKSVSKTKIEQLLTLIEQTYKNDKENAREILLGFLYAKALPDNDHDMLHYLAGLSQFMTIFENQEPQETKNSHGHGKYTRKKEFF